MTETKKEVKTYLVNATCDCGGVMVFQGISLLSHPPQYPHKCQLCDKVENLSDMYPYTTTDTL